MKHCPLFPVMIPHIKYVPPQKQMTNECMPWEKGQVVVMLSRTRLASDIYIVGDKQFAINKLWEIICRKTQWSSVMETILRNLSTNADGVEDPRAQPDFIPVPEVFPFRMCDVQLPHSNCGYVYLLISVSHPAFTYVGQTDSINRRLVEHNSGHGSEATAPTMYLPYHIAAYMITPNLSQSARMSLEARWQRLNDLAHRQGNTSVSNLVDNGRVIMEQHNATVGPTVDERIRFISHIQTQEESSVP